MTAASAYSPEPVDGRPSEPSMEDILASIRRIIADDQTQDGKPAAGGGSRRSATQAPEGSRAVARTRTSYDDVLDLARLVPSADRAPERTAAVEPVRVPAPPPPEAPAAQAADDGGVPGEPQDGENEAAVSGLRARLPEPVVRGAAPEEDHDVLDHPVPAVNDEAEGELLSAPLGASVVSAFETLAATVVLENTPMLERIMRDLLRPMLKTWLDDNLPALVERLVRAEIERVARGSRG